MEAAARCGWSQARRLAGSVARPLESLLATPDDAVGSVLAQPMIALADMPAYDTALADGWAVAGPGPWSIRPPRRRDMLAGLDYHDASNNTKLHDGQAAPVAAGEALGAGVTGVVANARCRVEGKILKLGETPRNLSNYIQPGAGIRPRGADAGFGSVLLPAREPVTPAVAALAAAAGHDSILIVPMPSVALIRVGDQLLDRGIPRSGLARDAVAPALPGWIGGLRGRCQPARWVTGGDAELIDEIDDVMSDIVVTAGPSSGSAVRRVLHGMRADVIVDGVECQPGESMLLAQLQDGRPLLHCGGAPADAVTALVTLLAPIIAGMTEQPDPATRARFDDAVPGDRRRTQLVAVRPTRDRGHGYSRITPGGPGGLLALSQATALAVIPPLGVRPNETVTILPMP